MRSILGLGNVQDAEEDKRLVLTQSASMDHLSHSIDHSLSYPKETPFLHQSLRTSAVVNYGTSNAIHQQIKPNNPLLVDNSSSLALYYKNYGGLQV